MKKQLLIQNGTLIVFNHEKEKFESRKNASLLIEGKVIKAIYRSGEIDKTYKNSDGINIIDAKGKLVFPGLINGHTHAAMTLFRSYADDLPLNDWLEKKIWPLESRLSSEDVYWGTLLAIVEMLRNGVTTFCDMYFFMEEVAKAVEESGMRGILCQGLIGSNDTDRRALKASEAFYSGWNNKAEGRIKVTFGPHAPYTCPLDYLREVIEISAKLKAPLHTHLAETPGEVDYCLKNFNMHPVELMDSIGLFERPTLAAHCVHLTEKEMEIMAEKGVIAVINTGSNLKLASGIPALPELIKAGVSLALGTDGAASNNNLNLLEEIRLNALIYKGIRKDPLLITADKALELGTVAAGKVVFGEKVGSLETGFLADIVIMDYEDVPALVPGHNPIADLVYSASQPKVSTIIINGNVVFDGGKCRYVDEEKVLWEAKSRAFKLVGID